MVYLGKFVKGKAVSSLYLMLSLALNYRPEAYLHQDPPLGQGYRRPRLGAKVNEDQARLPEERDVRGVEDGAFQPHEDSYPLA